MAKDFSDEELVAQSHFDEAAYNTLCKRYLDMRSSITRIAYPVACDYLDEWTTSECLLLGLVIAIKSYKPNMGSSFRTFLIRVVHNELANQFRHYWKGLGGASVISLDYMVADADGSINALGDIVQIKPSIDTDPVAFLNWTMLNEALKKLTSHKRKLTRKLIEYLRLDYSLREAARLVGISYAKARYLLKELAKELRKLGYID